MRRDVPNDWLRSRSLAAGLPVKTPYKGMTERPNKRTHDQYHAYFILPINRSLTPFGELEVTR